MHFIFTLLLSLNLFLSSGISSNLSELEKDETPSISFSHAMLPQELYTEEPVHALSTSNIGPILQEKSATHFRLLVQGPMPAKELKKNVNFLIGTKIQSKGSEELYLIRWGLLNPLQHNITHVDFKGLKANTAYDIQFAFVRGESIPSKAETFADLPTLSLHTLDPESEKRYTSFILFSCMWNGKWGPFEFGMKETRQGWRSVQKNIQHAFLNGIETDGILGAGDQIYADFAGKLAYAQSLRDFVKRYHLPYSSDEFKAVTSQIPYQTIPDDHAVTNDSGARDHYSHSKKGLQRFDNGMSAARLLEFPPEQPDNCYWRETLIGNVPIFFADLRRERDKVEGRIMGETQFKALKVFLMLHQQTIPLLVFSVPFSTQDGHGSCTDYPIWQKELMEFAQEQQLKFVIFSGDTHVGYTHVFQAKDSDGKNVGRPVLEATVSGFHAHSHGKAPSTKSIIDRTSQGGLRFESTSPINVLHPAADKKHPVHKKDLFARMTFDHETDDVHIEYFRIKNNQKLMGLTYHSIEGTSKWDE